MIRLAISILIGLGFVVALVCGLFVSILTPDQPEGVEKEFHLEAKEMSWASDGPLGKWDDRALQRGYQVYKEVCSACHSIHRVAFRDLEQIGYSEAEVKAIAKSWQVPDINPENGEPTTRDGLPSDHFPMIYANDAAARAAQNNAIPPDLSLITKARENGPRYVYSLLTGYGPIPAELSREYPDFKTPAGLHFNRYFPNLNLAMTPPLVSDSQVTPLDGTRPSVHQAAHDVVQFLIWTAEPNLIVRKQYGWAVVIFLLIFTGLAFGAYRQVWRDIKH